MLLSLTLFRYFSNRVLRSFSRHGALCIPVPVLINLASRADRLEAASRELEKVGLDYRLVPGVVHPEGTIGCAMAHRDLLLSYLEANEESVWILEDDIAFDVAGDELLRVVEAFLADKGLDVLCLSHLTPRPVLPISGEFSLTVSTFTTACYLVKPWAVGLLEKSFTESIIMLSLGAPPEQAQIDAHWRKLQRRKLVFCVPRKSIAYQSPSFSDIAGRNVDYYKKA